MSRGAKGQLSLSYDMTFLVLLLTGLYEPEEEKERGDASCIRQQSMNILKMYFPIMRLI